MMAWRRTSSGLSGFESSAGWGFAGGRQLPHAGHDGCVCGALLQEDFVGSAACSLDEGEGDLCGDAGFALGGGVFASGFAARLHRALEAERVAGKADGCAEFHHGLVEIAGALGVDELCGELLDFCGVESEVAFAVGRQLRFRPRHVWRRRTRSTLPSTTAADSPKAMLAMAAEV